MSEESKAGQGGKNEKKSNGGRGMLRSVRAFLHQEPVQRVLWVVAAATVAVTLYLLVWVGQQEREATARNFRVLAGLGKQIEEVVKLHKGRLANSIGGEVEPEEASELGVAIYRNGGGASEHRVSSRSSASSQQEESEPRYEVQPEGVFLVRKEGNDRRKFQLDPLLEPILQRQVFDHIVVVDHDGEVLFQPVSRQVRLGSLEKLSPAAPSNPKGVDAGRLSQVVVKLSLLGGESNPALKDSFDRHATTRIPKVRLSGTIYEVFVSPVQVPVAKVLTEAEKKEAGTVAGERFWRVCGLVETKRFQQEARALPTLPLVGLVLLLIGAILSLPLIKLHAVGSRENLSRSDLGWLLASILLIPAFLAMLIWGGWRYHQLRFRFDEATVSLAGELEYGFRSELREISQKLADVTGELQLKVRSLENALGKRIPVEKAEGASHDSGDSVEKSSELPLKQIEEFRQEVTGKLESVSIRSLYWIDTNGKQRIKVSLGRPTALLPLKGREYFQALARDFAPLPGTPKIFIQPIHSWSSAEPEVVVALSRREEAKEDVEAVAERVVKMPVVAAAIPLDSLIGAALPPGFGYAIVQNRDEIQGSGEQPTTILFGEVLLHSDKKRNLRENFLRETTSDGWLRSALLARTPEEGGFYYQGRHYRAHVRSLAPLTIKGFEVVDRPWSLIVFAESGIRSSLGIRSFTVATLLLFLYSALIVLQVAFFTWIAKRSTWDRIGPAAKPEVHASAFLFLLGLTLLLFGGLKVLEELGQLLWTVAVALMALLPVFLVVIETSRWRRVFLLALVSVEAVLLGWIGGTHLPHWWWPVMLPILFLFGLAYCLLGLRLGEIPDWLASQPLHRLSASLAILLLAVVPSLLFSKIVFWNEMELLVRSGQFDIANQLVERKERLEKHLGKLSQNIQKPTACQKVSKEESEAWVCLTSKAEHWEFTPEGDKIECKIESLPEGTENCELELGVSFAFPLPPAAEYAAEISNVEADCCLSAHGKGIYSGPFFNTCVKRCEDEKKRQGEEEDSRPYCPPGTGKATGQAASLLHELRPLYDEFSVATGGFFDPGDPRWTGTTLWGSRVSPHLRGSVIQSGTPQEWLAERSGGSEGLFTNLLPSLLLLAAALLSAGLVWWILGTVRELLFFPGLGMRRGEVVEEEKVHVAIRLPRGVDLRWPTKLRYVGWRVLGRPPELEAMAPPQPREKRSLLSWLLWKRDEDAEPTHDTRKEGEHEVIFVNLQGDTGSLSLEDLRSHPGQRLVFFYRDAEDLRPFVHPLPEEPRTSVHLLEEEEGESRLFVASTSSERDPTLARDLGWAEDCLRDATNELEDVKDELGEAKKRLEKELGELEEMRAEETSAEEGTQRSEMMRRIEELLANEKELCERIVRLEIALREIEDALYELRQHYQSAACHLHLALRRPQGIRKRPPAEEFHWIDLAVDTEAKLSCSDSRARLVIVDHFDWKSPEAEDRRKKLLSHCRGRRLILLYEDAGRVGEWVGASDLSELAWPKVMVLGWKQEGGESEDAALQRLRAVQMQERADGDPLFLTELGKVEKWLLENREAWGLEREDALVCMAEAVRPIYEELWRKLEDSDCLRSWNPAGKTPNQAAASKGAQGGGGVMPAAPSQPCFDALYALATGHWPTARAGRNLRLLKQLGFLARGSEGKGRRVRLANPSLVLYLRERLGARKAATPAGSPWSRLRAPLGVGLGIAIVFLFLTQPELSRHLLAALVALGGGIGGLTQLIRTKPGELS